MLLLSTKINWIVVNANNVKRMSGTEKEKKLSRVLLTVFKYSETKAKKFHIKPSKGIYRVEF